MTWVKIDDKLTTHPKWVACRDHPMARLLWVHGLVWCGAHNTDGIIPPESVDLIAFTAGLSPRHVKSAADQLVAVKLWRRRTKRDGGGFEVVNFLDFQPSRQQVQDREEAREIEDEIKRLHQWLHKRAVGRRVKAVIQARDGRWCRYCGSECVVTPGDRRGPHRLTYDLIDPAVRWDTDARAASDDELARLADLWAISCGWCNAIKGKRTPDEAGLKLLEPPTPSRRIDLDRSDATGPRADLPRPAATRSGTVPAVGTERGGSDPVGTARASPAAADEPPPHTDLDYPGHP